MIMQRLRLQHLSLILLAILLAACGGDTIAYAFGPTVWIDVPVDPLTLEAPQAIQIEGHANDPEGIAYVEIWVNGELVEAVDPLSVEGDLARYAYTWTPPGNGEYTIQAMAFANDGEGSAPDSTRVLIGEPTPVPDEPTPTSLPSPTIPPDADTPTEVPTEIPTLTPTPLPGAVVQFWAEPQQIQAGACTDIFWHVENVTSVVFGNVEQPFDGSYSDCLCNPQSYTLVVTHLDGTEERQRVDIGVIGDCITPSPTSPPPTYTPTIPPPDTQAPPAPAPSKPGNGASLSCVSSTTVMWNAVSDASGIAQYQVEVQRHAGDSNWQAVSGSPQTGIGGTSTSVSTECGWTYRWRVRAVDGVGNTGAWSEWFQFTIPLT
jgi:hypothetical protein